MNKNLLLADFATWLDAQDYSRNTKRSYIAQVGLFIEQEYAQAAAEYNEKELEEHVINYRNFLKEKLKLKAQSINVATVALSQYAVFRGYKAPKFTCEKKENEECIELMSFAELIQVREYIRQLKTNRDKCILFLALRYGLSAGFLCALDLEDFSAENGAYTLNLKSKSKKAGSESVAQTLRISDQEIIASLRSWIEERQFQYEFEPALFISKIGKRMTNDAVNAVIRRAGVEARVPLTGRKLVETYKNSRLASTIAG